MKAQSRPVGADACISPYNPLQTPYKNENARRFLGGHCSCDQLLSGLVSALSQTADLTGSGVLMDDTLALGRVDSRDSGFHNSVLISGVADDGSVCLLDHCFQVGLDDLVGHGLLLRLDNTILLRLNVRHSFHLLGSP